MNNTFKSNSRFSCLIEEIPENKKQAKKNETRANEIETNKFNSFKSERRVDYSENNKKDRYKEREYKEREEKLKLKKEFLEKERKKKIEESLHIDNFPELISNKKNLAMDEKDKVNFGELFKNNNLINKKINNDLDPDLNDLKPGCILIKMDPTTRKIVIKKHPNDEKFLEKEVVKTENELAYETIDSLVKLHEKRTQQYIELYGYDTWEKMFKFPNWEQDNFSDLEEESDEDEEDEYDFEDEY